MAKKMFAKYLSADSCFVKTTQLTVMKAMIQTKLKMNLCIALTEMKFCKLLRPHNCAIVCSDNWPIFCGEKQANIN